MDRQKFSAITRDALKQLNMERIYMVLRDSAGISRLDLSRELGLSLPTIAKNLNCLEEKGLILSAGTDNHTGEEAPGYIAFPRTADMLSGSASPRGRFPGWLIT